LCTRHFLPHRRPPVSIRLSQWIFLRAHWPVHPESVHSRLVLCFYWFERAKQLHIRQSLSDKRFDSACSLPHLELLQCHLTFEGLALSGWQLLPGAGSHTADALPARHILSFVWHEHPCILQYLFLLPLPGPLCSCDVQNRKLLSVPRPFRTSSLRPWLFLPLQRPLRA